MRRLFVPFALLVAAIVPCASASAHGAAEAGHGADPAAVDRGPEVAKPTGGRRGKPLSGAARRRARAVASASRLPTNWCGEERGGDDREHELANGDYRYHAVYMHAADSPSRFGSFASTIQTDAFQASGLLEASYGRALRFDMGTSCGPQYLDITSVRLSETAAQLQALAAQHEGTVSAVISALNSAGLPALTTTEGANSRGPLKTNYVVWLDAPGPSGACGQATIYDDARRAQDNANNTGGKLALVFRGGSGFCGSNTVRHEIGHNLGALQPAAPHAFDGAHCDDAYEDTMCYSSAPRVSDGARGKYFDYGNDDYWDPPGGAALPWWTVNLSRFLCLDTTCNVPAATPEPAPAPDAPAPAPETEAPAIERATLSVSARRNGHSWRLVMRARGNGEGVVTVSCRRRSGARVSRVYTKRVALPRKLHARVGCSSRPVATLTSAAGAAKVRIPRRGGRARASTWRSS